MSVLRNTAKQSPVISYFTSTFLFSWIMWLLGLYVFHTNLLLRDLAMVAGLFGPSLMALAIGRLMATDRQVGGRRPRAVLFAASLTLITSIIVLSSISRGAPVADLLPLMMVAVLIASLPAFIVSRALSKTHTIRSYMASLLVERTSVFNYAVAIMLFPVFLGIGWLLSIAAGFHAPEFYTRELHGLSYIQGGPLLFAHTFFMSGGITEEPGWRGFALKHLLKKRTPLVATVVLWLFWTIWHAPMKFGPPATHPPVDVLIEWLSLLPISFIFTWLYLRSNGNLMCAALLHTSMNTASAFIPITTGSNILLGVIFLFCLVSGRMWSRMWFPQENCQMTRANEAPSLPVNAKTARPKNSLIQPRAKR